MIEQKNVVVIGCWHLGSVIGTCLADSGHQVQLWDQDARVQKSWQSGEPPIFEPGLKELVSGVWGKRLFWAGSNLGQALSKADWILFAYDLPVNDQDVVSLEPLEKGFEVLAEFGLNPHANIVVTSQATVGSSLRLASLLRKKVPQWKGEILYTPENLQLGTAIKSMRQPDRVVLGVESPAKNGDALLKEFRNFYALPETNFNMMGIASAEMVKHALNSFLAMCVVYGNEMADICEKTGANCWDVVASLKQDSRVGPRAFVRPGLGFAGATLARDVRTLWSLSPAKSSNLFETLYDRNSHRNEWVINTLKSKLGDLKNRKIALLGITYKPGTSTVRRSQAIEIASLLKNAGAQVLAVDPMADLSEIAGDFQAGLPFEKVNAPERALEGADAAVLVTPWPEFKSWEWATLKVKMKRPLLIDTARFLSDQLKDFEAVVPGLN